MQNIPGTCESKMNAAGATRPFVLWTTTHQSFLSFAIVPNANIKRKNSNRPFSSWSKYHFQRRRWSCSFISSQQLCAQWPKLGSCPVLKTEDKNTREHACIGGPSAWSSTVQIAGIIIRLLFHLDLSHRVSDKTFSKWIFKPQGSLFLSWGDLRAKLNIFKTDKKLQLIFSSPSVKLNSYGPISKTSKTQTRCHDSFMVFKLANALFWIVYSKSGRR